MLRLDEKVAVYTTEHLVAPTRPHSIVSRKEPQQCAGPRLTSQVNVLAEIFKVAVPSVPASSPIPLWVELVFGGIGATIIQAVGKRVAAARSEYRKMKRAPDVQETEDITTMKADIKLLKTGYEKLNAWLGGTKDFLGQPKHDGFIETFPAYQNEVRETLAEILDRLPKNGNGHT